MMCDTHPLTHDFGAAHHSQIHAHDMTQQAAVDVVQKFRTEHQEDCAVLARPTPAQRPPCPALPGKARTARTAGPCNYFERLVTCGPSLVWVQASDTDLEWSQVFAQISLGLGCSSSGVSCFS